MEYRCLVNAAAQFQIANLNDQRYKVLGALSVTFTALAAGSVTDALSGALNVSHLQALQPFTTAVLVIALGIMTALLNFLDPKAERERALQAGRQLNGLRDTLRLLRMRIVANDCPEDEFLKELKSAHTRYAEIEATMLTIPGKIHVSAKASQETNLHYRELRQLTGRPPPPEPKDRQIKKSY